jgi:hypothetical protein
MERWGEVNHPLVKTVAGLAVPLFLVLNFPVALLAIMAGGCSTRSYIWEW